jgi:cytoskeletal protein RodZ
LGTGVAFTTSSHPWIADAFYVASAILFVAKFITWEDVDPTRRRGANSITVLVVAIILVLVIGGNHRLNPKGKSDAPNLASEASKTANESPGKNADSTKKLEQSPAKDQATSKSSPQSLTVPDTAETTNKTVGSPHVKTQSHSPKNEMPVKPNATSPASPITINNAPGGFAISGGTVSNPTVNNFGSPSRTISSDFQEPLRALLAKQVATVRVYAVNDMEANEFAQEWYDLLAAAGWHMKDQQVILAQLEKPWRGVRVGYRGEPQVDDKGMVTVPGNSPESTLVSALMTAKVEKISVNPKPELEADFIELLVSSNPRH